MSAVFLLASIAVGIMALGQTAIGAITRQPFSGIHAATYWVLTAACILLGALAIYFYFNDPTPGAYA